VKAERAFWCVGCHRERPANPRLRPGQQSFCSSRRCQRKRKRAWDLNQQQSNEVYRKDQAAAKLAYRQSDLGRRYDRDYKRRLRCHSKKGAPAASSRPQSRSKTVSDPHPPSPHSAGTPPGRYRLESLDDPRAPIISVLLTDLGQSAVEAVPDSIEPFRHRVQDGRVGPPG